MDPWNNSMLLLCHRGLAPRRRMERPPLPCKNPRILLAWIANTDPRQHNYIRFSSACASAEPKEALILRLTQVKQASLVSNSVERYKTSMRWPDFRSQTREPSVIPAISYVCVFIAQQPLAS